MGFKIIKTIAGKTYVFDEDKMELISDHIRYLVRIPYTDEPKFIKSKQAMLYRGVSGYFVIKYRNYEDSEWYFDVITSDRGLLNILVSGDDREGVEVAEKLFGPFAQG